MPTRFGRILGALAVLLAGLAVARRSSSTRREIPVPPGNWEPVGDGD